MKGACKDACDLASWPARERIRALKRIIPRRKVEGVLRDCGRSAGHRKERTRLRATSKRPCCGCVSSGTRVVAVRNGKPRLVAFSDQADLPWRDSDGALFVAVSASEHAAVVGPQFSQRRHRPTGSDCGLRIADCGLVRREIRNPQSKIRNQSTRTASRSPTP